MAIGLVVPLVGTVVVVVLLVLQLAKTQHAVRVANTQRGELANQAAALGARVQVLAKYQHIIDVEAAAAQMHATAQHRAASIVGQAQQEALRLIGYARQEATCITSQAQAALTDASSEAARTIAEAKANVEQLKRAANAASEDAKRLQATAGAMRNVIDGYGDRYLVPTTSLLDNLAEEFGFTEAGARLKHARDRMREMIRGNSAAACDDEEADRRAMAIDFVVDAFNGKVDAVLKDVRHDNYGTLQQKIQDAFHLVNHNGCAFRNAHVTPAYLATRLEELRWAAVVQELKLKQREEQQLLKDRIKEEERAQREFERLSKKAEKEEDVLRKAMAKARLEIEKASGARKTKYESQLLELAERLRVAEEKNQRAISAARPTKAGHVYVISNVGSFGEDVFKIGLTRQMDPLDRIRELGDASVPFEFDVHAIIRCDDAPALEHALHKKFVSSQINKVNPRKAFFRLQLDDIRRELERLNIEVTWTMLAEAREYRETLAVERAIANRTIDEKVWAQQQVRGRDAAVAGRGTVEVN
jgi:hypothetical protein